MPCGCFGTKKKKKEGPETGASKEGPEKGPVSAVDAKVLLEGEAAKKKDVIASDGVDDCPLVGFRSTGSRPPSSYVDSPRSNSHPHTPSTLPAVASSASSPASSVASSPEDIEEASCRAHLAQKRREFFSELYPGDYRRGPTQGLPSTLPTAARARQFGKVRPMRPASQPSPEGPPPVAPPLPPGPHLLRHTETPRAEQSGATTDGGFASPGFLLELRSASDEISRRWAMTEGEREVTPSVLKEKAKTQKMSPDGSSPQSPSPTHTSPPPPLRSVDVVVTPPSPPSAEVRPPELTPSCSPTSRDTHETNNEQRPPEEDGAPHEHHSAVGHTQIYPEPSAPEYSEEEDDDEALKQLSSALERADDSFDLSDEPGDRGVHSDLCEGEGEEAARLERPLDKQTPFPVEEDVAVPSSGLAHDEGTPPIPPTSTDTNISTPSPPVN